MKKLIFVLLMMCSSVFAQAIDVSKLSPAQQAELQAKVAEMAPTNTSAKVREEVSAWAEMGTNLGQAVVAGAKELGVAANEFSKTTPGKIVIAITVYKIVGKDILGILIGTALLIVSTAIFLMFHQSHRKSDRVYELRPVFWGLYNRNTLVSYKESEIDGAAMFISSFFLIVVWIGAFIIILT
jgi:hypothetical protein